MIRVGVAGWDYPDWESIVYPKPAPRGFDRLRFMAGHFDTLELNVTFYRQPDRAAAASWARLVEACSAQPTPPSAASARVSPKLRIVMFFIARITTPPFPSKSSRPFRQFPCLHQSRR